VKDRCAEQIGSLNTGGTAILFNRDDLS